MSASASSASSVLGKRSAAAAGLPDRSAAAVGVQRDYGDDDDDLDLPQMAVRRGAGVGAGSAAASGEPVSTGDLAAPSDRVPVEGILLSRHNKASARVFLLSFSRHC